MRQQVDAVLFLQSANVLLEPRCLARLHAAASTGVPISCAAFNASKAEHTDLMYNFETTKPTLADLSGLLDDGVAAALTEARFRPFCTRFHYFLAL